ncbi:tRNA(m5U54)methyltransferase [Cytospora paraplurivora]|uniref:tRNA (uracil(54)-C(5))-methyltransferase n=1 Tax=Cytospora paraplurivora TaxID=2898453 RepID=A0AAN9UGW7_9PEZI
MATTTPQPAPATLPVPAPEVAQNPELPKQPNGKRPFKGAQGSKQKMKKKNKPKPAMKEGSHEEVLMADIQAMLAEAKLSDDNATEETAPEAEAEAEKLPEQWAEIEVEVLKLSSNGDGLARQPGSKQIYVVPFCIPGDTVKVKVYRHLNEGYSVADFVSVVKPSPLRDDSRIQCKYFAQCGGCQFQMMDYSEQLKHKKTIVERAYRNFSDLPPELVPQIQDTMGSPLQYGYRTKLTPHFDGPPGFHRKGRWGGNKEKKFLQEMPAIGFMQKQGPRKTLDIEDCPIGTEAVRKAMARERERMKVEYGTYERGATILLREDTKRVPKAKGEGEGEVAAAAAPTEDAVVPEDAVVAEGDDYTDYKTCITDNNATSTEYIDDFVFTNPAGAFFQNNNSILSPFTDYIRQHILPPPQTSSSPASEGQKPIKYLIDAYSGSGLFTITMSKLFSGGSIGIDIADKSISFARTNARLNGLPESQCSFIAADAPQLFKSVSAFDPDETVVVLDPPRKGCDASFLRQLLGFAPRRVVYVSCNVHTQARDVGVLVRGEVDASVGGEAGKGEGEGDGAGETKKKTRYEIESLVGFDFFPQTSHVEGVAVLNRVDA